MAYCPIHNYGHPDSDEDCPYCTTRDRILQTTTPPIFDKNGKLIYGNQSILGIDFIGLATVKHITKNYIDVDKDGNIIRLPVTNNRCDSLALPSDQTNPKKPELKTALKYNKGKLRIRLCPPFVKEMMINALEFGCTKYFENSWRKGFMVADMYDATNRHLDAFFHEREDIDEESGCHHLDCALFSLAMMKYSVVLEGKDNRPPVTPEQIEEVIRLGMIEIQKREVEENDDN